MTSIFRVSSADRVPGPPTAGMTREEAVATDGMWGGFVTTEAGMVSGWHHHGAYESTIYVLTGALRMEYGPGGRDSFDAGPGDFVYVGKGIVHRESDPSPEPATIVVVRAGEGEPVVNVDGPDEA
ncbi:MAG: cupin domain-containing protein [Gemmatimonadota bacterium]